jgi:hypothetical protein
MAKDLRIRPIGKPKIEEDSQLGFQKLTRRFAAEGTKVTKDGLDGTDDGIALFRRVGEPDEEYPDHYLVNQQTIPGETLDSCTLVRQYAQLRDSWFSQQSSESGELKKLTRKYVVLKNSNHILKQLGNLKNLGYDSREWSLHPATGSGLPDGAEALDDGTPESNADCWDMLPEIIRRTEPKLASYVDGDAAGNIPDEAGQALVSLATVSIASYVVYPRSITIGAVDTVTNKATVTVESAAPWKLGGQVFSSQEGRAVLDDTQLIAEGETFVVLGDPRDGQGIDDPDTHHECNEEVYTEQINKVGVGESIELDISKIKPVQPNMTSVNAQGEDGYIAYDLEEEDRQSHFIEDLALTDQQISISSNEHGYNLRWLRASASVDTSSPGVDIWTCSWVAPIGSYWKILSSTEKNATHPTIVGFDHTGFKAFKRGSKKQGAPAVLTYFTVAEQAPYYATTYAKNSGAVTMDFYIVLAEGSSKSLTFKQSFSNAAFYQSVNGTQLRFPTEFMRTTGEPDFIDVACLKGAGCGGIAAAQYINRMGAGDDVTVPGGSTLVFFYNDPYGDTDWREKPLFQGRPIQSAGGHISWDATIWNNKLTKSPSSMKVTPLHHHHRNRIWKIEVIFF